MAESKQFTTTQIINHVVNYYKTNPRSFNYRGTCAYTGVNGEHCGFAILCEKPELITEGSSISDILKSNIKLKPEFDGQTIFFYQDIQALHDTNFYWEETYTGNKLTQTGIERVKFLKKFYN